MIVEYPISGILSSSMEIICIEKGDCGIGIRTLEWREYCVLLIIYENDQSLPTLLLNSKTGSSKITSRECPYTKTPNRIIITERMIYFLTIERFQ
jgi:hypothetical protein